MQMTFDIFDKKPSGTEISEEIWKLVVCAPGYEVSSFGRFRHRIRGLLKGTKAHNGYIHIGLMIEGYQKWMLAHRVVAMAFLGNPKNHPVVNHIDGNRENNRVDNLEWASRSHNARDMWARKKGNA